MNFEKFLRTPFYRTSLVAASEPRQHSVPEFDTIIFDGAAVVQIVSLKASQTFQQYCRNELHSFLMHKINKAKCAIVTNMLRYILFCTISLIVLIFQIKSQTMYTHRLYLHSYV